MAHEPATPSEHAIAQQTQEKFELYLLSLVFTLLALTIQTASFGVHLTKDALELGSWLCLLVSGLAGLWRLQWIPTLRVQMAERAVIKNEIVELKESQRRGQTELIVQDLGAKQPISERLIHRNAALKVYDSVILKQENRVSLAYELHKYGFVVALTLAIASRGFEPGLSIAKHLCNLVL